MIASIFEATLRSAALIAIVWIAVLALRIRNPHLERAAWRVVLCASFAMPLLMVVSSWPAVTLPTSAWVPEAIIADTTATKRHIEWATWASAIYLAVAALLLLRQTFAVLRLVRLVTSSSRVEGHAGVRICDHIRSPVTVFSTILLPRDSLSWSERTLATVLAHERAHVENHDFYVQWLAQLHRSIFWCNPLAWWLPTRLSLLNEHISDDAALRVMNEDAGYAQLLVDLARSSLTAEPAIAMARPSTLACRIERILDSKRSIGNAGFISRATMTAAVISLVGIVAGFQTQAQPAQSSSPASNEPLSARTELSVPPSKVVLPRSSPALPLSQPIYPPTARRLRQSGTVVLKLLVLEDGTVADAAIEKSTGYPDLDYAAMYEAFRWRMLPGTTNGLPDRMWGKFAVTFKLKN